ncbi:MFS transporter [candidate division KSB1 bacterium RBG_16_48_16]|nr:MAG: MFS transporter [candidate division KSB1 bacterium RBG_16_48_16]
MKANNTPGIEKEPSATYRWTVLFFISMAMFGNYYIYDSISPLADLLKKQLGFSDANIGLLNAIYSLPNIIMVLIGGIIIDRIGTKKASFLFSAFCMVGAIITVLQGKLFSMAAGRLIFGMGAESLIVAVTTVIAKWFRGKEFSLAFGLNLTVARLGSFTAINSPTIFKPLYTSWQKPLFVSAIAGLVSVIAVIIYFLLESKAAKRYTLLEGEKIQKIDLKRIFTMQPSFWYVVLLCVTFYSAIFPFQTFAVKFFMEQHGLTREVASRSSSLIVLAAMIGTPLFGLLIDKVGRRASLMMLGSILILPVYLVLAYSTIHPLFSMLAMGVAFSLVPAAMWPSVALIVDQERLGTAYGLMTMIQNIGLAGFNLLIGFANDVSGGYTLGMWIFSSLGFFGMLFAWLLRKSDLKHDEGRLEHSTMMRG